MDTIFIWLEFAVLLACIFIGSRYGGVGLGLWGSLGVFVLTYVFGLGPHQSANRCDADHPGGHYGCVGHGSRRWD